MMKNSLLLLSGIVVSLTVSSCSTNIRPRPTSSATIPTSDPIKTTTQIDPSSTSSTASETTTTTSITTSGSTITTTATTTQSSQSSQSTTSSSSPPIDDYYKNISSSATGDTLKIALYNLIKGHNTSKTSYKTLEQAMKITDRNWTLSPDRNDTNPYMNLLYMVGNDTTPHRWNTYHGSGGMIDNAHWDKEHIWVKSNGFKSEGTPAHFDLHHLRASDMKNNNNRSNLPYGPVSGGTIVYDYDGNPSGKKTSECYEPLDRDKGDVARAIMYMATRYYNGDGSAGTCLTLTDGKDSTGGKFGYLSTLLQWNLIDPPSEFETNRNNLIYNEYQNNRNPFIDHPEYACRIWGTVSSKTQSVCK